tara:strand:- start:3547 stop:3798 length:252 start_codon:yes stop_codon:yes gene_type:complete
MSKVNNGDMPAQPTHYQESGDDEYYCADPGLSKREHFAVMAMQGWLARCANVPHTACLDPSVIAEVAVTMADALLKQLEIKAL